MAFFPCIYFETVQALYYTLEHHNQKKKPICERIKYAIERIDKRTYFHIVLYKMVFVCYQKNIRMVIENPTGTSAYLTVGQNFIPPTIVDKNRRNRGDYFKKPTAYWFINCDPSNLMTYEKKKEEKTVEESKKSPMAGVCSEERSMISPDYARNFICDFILGKEQIGTQLKIFE